MKVRTILSTLAVICSAAVVTVSASASAMDVSDEPVDAEVLASYTAEATSEDEIDAVESEEDALPISDDTVESMTEEVTSSEEVANEEVTNEIATESEDGGAESNSEKGSPDTGVAGVATAVGAAIVGGGAMLLSRKRK